MIGPTGSRLLEKTETESALSLRPINAAPARSDLIVNEIRRAILQGEIAPGTPLVERDLAQALGVSKTPVREAIKSLVATGLVEVSPYRGASVRKVDHDLARNVYAVRLLLEPEAVRLAALRSPASEIEHAEQTLENASVAASRRDYSLMALFNREFHQTLTKASGNSTLVDVLASLQDQTALVATQGWRKQATWNNEANEHLAILVAVRNSDGNLAASLMHAHISSALTTIVSRLDGDTEGRRDET